MRGVGIAGRKFTQVIGQMFGGSTLGLTSQQFFAAAAPIGCCEFRRCRSCDLGSANCEPRGRRHSAAANAVLACSRRRAAAGLRRESLPSWFDSATIPSHLAISTAMANQNRTVAATATGWPRSTAAAGPRERCKRCRKNRLTAMIPTRAANSELPATDACPRVAASTYPEARGRHYVGGEVGLFHIDTQVQTLFELNPG